MRTLCDLEQMNLPSTEIDLRGLARLKAAAPIRPPVFQKACDIGLFSDDADQLDLIEMLIDPVE